MDLCGAFFVVVVVEDDSVRDSVSELIISDKGGFGLFVVAFKGSVVVQNNNSSDWNGFVVIILKVVVVGIEVRTCRRLSNDLERAVGVADDAS